MLKNEWQSKTRHWGHPLHSLCPYPGALPARLPHYFIQKFTRRGDVVLDPFCGAGAAPLQACVEGRTGVGVDADPLAFALTFSKLNPPDPADLRNRIDDLSNDMFFAVAAHEPDRLRALFHPETLRQLVYLKQSLRPDCPVDAFIIAMTLGLLRGAPGASRSSRCLEATRADIFAFLRRRLGPLLRYGLPQTPGRAWKSRVQDMADLLDPALKRKKVKLILSAPPGLKTPRFALQNWVRLWFLGENSDETASRHHPIREMKDYLRSMREACRFFYRVLAPGGVCALVIPDAPGKTGEEPVRLAEELWSHLSKKRSRFQLAQIIKDSPVAPAGESGPEAGKEPESAPAGKPAPIDRILVLYKDRYEEETDRVAW